MDREISRREFVKGIALLGLSAATAGSLFSWLSCSGNNIPEPSPSPTPVPPPVTPSPIKPETYIAIARGQNPSSLVQAAIKALGGIERFVKKGDDVIVKPNICNGWNNYEYAATTNPEVMATLITLCLGAGAGRVRAMDFPCGTTTQQAYAKSGIAEAVEAAGGEMEIMVDFKFQETSIPEGRDITSWPVYKDILDADVVINVPIAKQHGPGHLTLGMKNLMGVIQDRPMFHSNLGQRIADLNSLVRPQLTVIDAVRILVDHGPNGGSLDDVRKTDTVIASQDVVAADSYATTLFGMTGRDIPAIRAGAEMGLGTMDLNQLKIEEIKI
jgi:uncharacterized protein (DUF362 family)